MEYLEHVKKRYQNANRIEIEFMDGTQLRDTWKSQRLGDLHRLLDRYFGTRRKRVYDPTLEKIVEAPSPEYEQYVSAIPDPNEVPEFEQSTDGRVESAERSPEGVGLPHNRGARLARRTTVMNRNP